MIYLFAGVGTAIVCSIFNVYTNHVKAGKNLKIKFQIQNQNL